MAWIYLVAAAAFEIVFVLGMKYAEGFTRPMASAATIVGAIAGIVCLTLSMKTLPVSVAYPIWTAVGTLGAVILGTIMLGESLTPAKLASAIAIVAGVAGLKLTSA
jgi:quaternary ammonium compound-resistance protein SugE